MNTWVASYSSPADALASAELFDYDCYIESAIAPATLETGIEVTPPVSTIEELK